ncbi:MAG TPA: 3-phosphoshikimate 1-carboxyvinyltransferase [Verrucomicrobiae bacterium]|nr:3-phosphoshikimate 1-carboxyvinyltransferase [Verrucomicrobiae bacterium]
MPLPEIIEIHPVARPVRAEVTVPGSKSLTNRALVLAALGRGTTELRHALWSEDTQVMVDCLSQLGFSARVAADETEAGNRNITVAGLNGKIPRSGTQAEPLPLFVGNAGTAARFLAALVCLGKGYYRLAGVQRMHERPQCALFQALRQLGYEVQSTQDKLPATVRGDGARAGACIVSIEESSQFASALILAGEAGGWSVQIVGENSEESPYVAMTTELRKAFPQNGGVFPIEPDASSASYIWGAEWLLKRFPETAGSSVRVAGSMRDSLQIDSFFPGVIDRFPAQISRRDQLGDSIMTAIVLAPFADGPKEFTELGRLRVQECERVEALRAELTKCGGKIEETGESLKVFPSALRGATIETYQDHRMAMCFGTLALKVAGIKIKNPACVKKTFPNFFQKLAAAPPAGLGARITDAMTGRFLKGADLE